MLCTRCGKHEAKISYCNVCKAYMRTANPKRPMKQIDARDVAALRAFKNLFPDYREVKGEIIWTHAYRHLVSKGII